MIDELIKEIEELRTIKTKYEYLQKDKETMSKLLYKYMIKEYNSKSYDERADEFRVTICKDCKLRGCNYTKELPIDILKPIESDVSFIPSKISCKKFKWD
jgi:hypothetical protein